MSVQSKFLAMLTLLFKRGFVLLSGDDLSLSDSTKADLKALCRSALNAPLDPNCANGTRRRRFERAFFLPGSTKVVYFPRKGDADLDSIQAYHQSASYNPVEGGKERPFAAFTEIQRDLPGLEELLLLDAEIARIVLQEPDAILEGHVHLIAYIPGRDTPSMSSPHLVHCDSEPLTFTHLLGRKDVTGGFNAVTTLKARNCEFATVDKSEILSTFTLEEPLQSFVVVDDRVAHYVAPIEAAGPQPYRIVLLVDFTPLIPKKGKN